MSKYRNSNICTEIAKLKKRVAELEADTGESNLCEELQPCILDVIQEELSKYDLKEKKDQGLTADYSGTGWYKATDTGIVYNVGVPHGETHTFEGDPVEYIALSDAGLDPTVHGADFQHVLKDFQANLHRYAISDVTDLSYALNAYNNSVLGYDEEFKEVDLSHWDTSSVTKTIATFAAVKNTRIKGLENWDMSKVENMNYMFMDSEAAEFSDISGWDTSSVNSMEAMFQRAASFNQDLSQWCVPLITTAPERFDSKASSWTLPKPAWGTCPG